MCKTESSSPINLIRFINEKANDVYGGTKATFIHADYIRHCSDAFADYFKVFFGDRYLFSTLSAWNRKKADGKIFFANPDRRYDYSKNVVSIFRKIIEGPKPNDDCLLNDIPLKSISITKYILQESFGIDVFFMGDDDYPHPINCNQNSHKISFFPLNKINFYSDIEQFENDSFNRLTIVNLANELRMPNDSDYTYRKACRLVWYYKKMQVEYRKEKGKDFMVHFIRPSFIDFDHNMLLSLATNELLSEEELAFVDLILFKIVGLMATERVKQNEEIERLRNVSASTHVIKTTINGLFAPPLNSLLQENSVDNRIKELQTAKEKFIKYAEVINLMSKLSSPYKNENEIKKSLIGSELFTENKNELGNIDIVLNEIIELRKIDCSLTILNFVKGNGSLSEDAFVYANKYYPAKSFYELLLLTNIENLVEHGETDDGKLTITMNLSENEITFVNKSKPNEKEIRVEDLTGNFRVFHTILKKLDLGRFLISNKNKEFKVTLISEMK